jgi:acetyl-CoA carboxylase/biotin carboxylase 1
MEFLFTPKIHFQAAAITSPATIQYFCFLPVQVWFPDSADKTAQAIEEFNREGLPLFILANWRGFAGGQRDLFDGVLQAGSMIVEHLRVYKQPVFVYMPCGAELRGGAWVVVDSQINPTHIETFADPRARGGVLEPEGVVEIKFRTPDLIKAMHRYVI